MLYVQQSLSPGEKIIHAGRFHWMYALNAAMGVFWGFLGCVAVIVGGIYLQQRFGQAVYYHQGWLEAVRETHPGIRLGAFMVFVMGVLRFAHMMLIQSTTEIAITTKRLIYKRGLVARYVGEMSIDKIESVNVLQNVWGRLFGYGRIMVRGMGVGEVTLPPVRNPIAFRRAIEMARGNK